MNKRLFKKISKRHLCFIIWDNFYEIYKNINLNAKILYQIYTEVDFNHSSISTVTDICECGGIKKTTLMPLIRLEKPKYVVRKKNSKRYKIPKNMFDYFINIQKNGQNGNHEIVSCSKPYNHIPYITNSNKEKILSKISLLTPIISL